MSYREEIVIWALIWDIPQSRVEIKRENSPKSSYFDGTSFQILHDHLPDFVKADARELYKEKADRKPGQAHAYDVGSWAYEDLAKAYKESQAKLECAQGDRDSEARTVTELKEEIQELKVAFGNVERLWQSELKFSTYAKETLRKVSRLVG